MNKVYIIYMKIDKFYKILLGRNGTFCCTLLSDSELHISNGDGTYIII